MDYLNNIQFKVNIKLIRLTFYFNMSGGLIVHVSYTVNKSKTKSF